MHLGLRLRTGGRYQNVGVNDPYRTQSEVVHPIVEQYYYLVGGYREQNIGILKYMEV